jgi:hypothetical protein
MIIIISLQYYYNASLKIDATAIKKQTSKVAYRIEIYAYDTQLHLLGYQACLGYQK